MALNAWFFDVGDCHSTYFQFEDNTDLLIDCGAGARSTANYLAKVSSIDRVAVTHPHADHIRSLADLQGKVRAFYAIRTDYYPVPCSEADTPNFDAYYALRRGGRIIAKGEPLKDDASGVIRVLAPADAPSAASSSAELNNASAILYIRYAKRSFLICGDNERESLQGFIDNWKPMQVDVLLAPHHGQQSGFNADFVRHVDPIWVIISSGSCKACDAYDDYSRLAREGVRTTRKHGTIKIVVSDRGELTIT